MSSIVTVALLTLAASFLCSLLEAALYTITPSQVEVLRRRGGRRAELLVRFRLEVEEPIAAILTINTVAHTVGSAWCGAMVAEQLGSRAVGVFAAVFTFLVLAVTEIVPKSLGVRYAARLGPWIGWPIQLMVWVALPVAQPAKVAMRLLTGRRGAEGPSEEEVLLFSKLAAQAGSMRLQEHEWLRNALRLDRLTAADIRTPRTVVESYPTETPVRDLRELAQRWMHSRVPLYEDGDPEKIVGFAFRREALDAALSGRTDLSLRDLMHPIQFVPEAMPANELLDRFIQNRVHLVAVADEYGGFEGVVTLEDVLEHLLGAEIVDEHDQVADLQEHARQTNPHVGD